MSVRATSSSSFKCQWKYDVFLNFRGEDTRNSFTGFLYHALSEKGIYTFMDDGELRKGDDIMSSLSKAIEQSRMAIIVFSENYAFSTFCLNELVKILQCIKRNGRLVWPIFYHVEPSHVRHQEGSYAEALALHESKFKANVDKLQSWNLALREVANISGFHIKPGHEYEYQFIERIVKEVSGKISRIPLHIADYPVGLESRMLQINSLLRLELNNGINMVGICGIGGVGKTTIARAVYNSIADPFEGLCFLHDVNDNSSKFGLEQMQEIILSKILGMDIKVVDVNEGVAVLKRRLSQKKVLLILDDVDKREQLEKLAGDCNWFGFGSRIIITTRNRQLLERHGIETIYTMKEFNDEESLELLCWNAFRSCNVDPTYMEVLRCAMQYTQGLPLALEVIGSQLFGKSINEWKSALDMYRRIPNKDIQQILQVSYNSLQELEQETFLDVACFFKGKELEYVKDMVQHAHGFDPDYGIGVLKDKCLIKIENGCIKMHDLIQLMGREIVRQESPREPGKRSRLWYQEDIIHVMENDTGTEKICAIIQERRCGNIKLNWDRMAFKRMTNLKILFLKQAWFLDGPIYLPSSLRVLQWWGYPASCLPTGFDPTNLAMLDLQGSCLQSLETKLKWKNMAILNLSKCQFIERIPDGSGLPNLIELTLEGCGKLTEISDSIGFLEKLEILDLRWCEKLRTFPCAIKMPNLQYLGLEGCLSLEKFPEILGKMQSIEELDLSDRNLELPFSICNMTGLRYLNMRGCRRAVLLPSSIDMLQGLEVISSENFREGQEGESFLLCPDMEVIRLPGCNISDEFLPICLTWFANVTCLNLSVNGFSILPACIKDCRLLEKSYLYRSKHLREIKGSPPKLEEVWARDCLSLSLKSRSILPSQELRETGDRSFFVPGSAILEWLHHRSTGPSISFWFRNRPPVISLCFVRKQMVFDVLSAEVIVNGRITLFNEGDIMKDTMMIYCSMLSNYMLMSWEIKVTDQMGMLFLRGWNHVEICIYEDLFRNLKEMGIHVKNRGSRMEDIRFTNPNEKTKFVDLNWNFSLTASSWLIGNDTETQNAANMEDVGVCQQTDDMEQQEDEALISHKIFESSGNVKETKGKDIIVYEDGSGEKKRDNIFEVTCQNSGFSSNCTSLTWDPIEFEYQVTCHKRQLYRDL